jgi:hypothetical protein
MSARKCKTEILTETETWSFHEAQHLSQSIPIELFQDFYSSTYQLISA